MSFQPDLQDLRAAARERDADRQQFVLKKLFMGMEFIAALGVTAECAYAYADTFERYHPDETWARTMVRQIVLNGVKPDEQAIKQAFQEFSTPGTANFLKALYDIYQGTDDRNQREARLGFLVSACVNSIMAHLVERWFGPRPARWQSYRTGADPQIALAFWTDEDIAATDTALWLKLADSIEAFVNR